MINKIYLERGSMYAPAMNVVFSIKIIGCSYVENLKTAIDYAVNRFEVLRCRVLQDGEGEAYYVMRENRSKPYIEVRGYHQSLQVFVNEQEKIPFKYTEGDLIRFYIEEMDDYLYLRIVNHHIAGDGRSVMILVDEIMKNLQEIEEGRFVLQDKAIIPLFVYSKEKLENELQMNDLLKFSMEEFNKKWKAERKVFNYEDYLHMFNQYWSENSTKVKTIKIEREDLARIANQCKENKVTINSVIITALSKAVLKSKKISVIVDARPDDYVGMGNFAGSLLIEGLYDQEKDFWENAQYIHNQIHTQLLDRKRSLFSFVFKGFLEGNFIDALSFVDLGYYESQVVREYNESYGLRKANVPFVISNLGNRNLERGYGQLKVEEAYFLSPLIPGMECNIGILTVADVLTLTMEYVSGVEIDYPVMLDEILEQLLEISCNGCKKV